MCERTFLESGDLKGNNIYQHKQTLTLTNVNVSLFFLIILH